MNPSPLAGEALSSRIADIDGPPELLERGGFKWVYRALVNGVTEALKVVPLIGVDDSDASPELEEAFLAEQAARVRREIESLRKCVVPQIVKLGQIAPVALEIDGQRYLAYSEEFVEGEDLWRLLRSGRSRPELAELIELFVSLLTGIEELWRHGYVHRDIKPHNVIRTNRADRRFVLLDLGIAFAIRETALTHRPQERMPLATYRYLAPEMMRPDFRDRIDYRTDLYTTGLTVFEYAAGCHPLARDADDLMRTISRALHQPPAPLSRYRPDLPPAFCTIVDRLLRKQPALRPANLSVMRRVLEELR